MTPPARPSSMMRDTEIWVFFLCIVVANTAFVFAISESWLHPGLYNLGRFLLLGGVLVTVVFAFRGWKAPLALLKPLTVWRIHPGWIPFVALWPPSIAMATLTGKAIFLGQPLSQIQITPLYIFEHNLLPILLISAFVGEIVWVGYAIARLRNWTTTFVASVIVGTAWYLWWLPIMLMNVGVIENVPALALFFNMIGVALMCGFVYGHTKSGIPILVLQLSFNSTLLIFPVIPGNGGVPTFIAFVSSYLLGSLMLHALFGPRPLLPSAAQRNPSAPRPMTQ